eukprot:SRR837773.26153.p2 GENE.SRR837773.26153~~SRR837773.26153.p2  ORF type:complete len:253 (+),score=57.22 SRR837773.26153:113-760(+)
MDPSRVLVAPMQTGPCVDRPFDPVFPASFALEFNELTRVIDEINGVILSAMPRWKVKAVFAMIPVGFVLFVLGGFLMVTQSGFDGPSPLGLACIFLGFITFASGGLSSVCVLSRMGQRAVSDLRRKLSELNARYSTRCVDFQLHESQHLELYTRHHDHASHGHIHHGTSTGVRTVTRYTLVIQAMQPGLQPFIPNPQVLAEQALRPSAPMVVQAF